MAETQAGTSDNNASSHPIIHRRPKFNRTLNFAENLPIGSVIGEFNGTDPDANTALTYHLVSGTGDNNNSLFTTESNGTLKTATTFDYENNASSYSIRVQAKDEFNATVEQVFTLFLTDVYEPSNPNHVVDLNSSVNLEMIWVDPGTFIMGSPISEPYRDANETEHNVTLTRGFYLGKYEVTQAQYTAVMTGNNDGLNPKPSWWPNHPNRPVETVSWIDLQRFLERLNQQEADNIPVGWEYTLPTEAQWEYACRAGTTTVYSWGDDINSSRANYNGSFPKTTNVGQYSANNWGFFDMHGNVWEWIADWHEVSYPNTNPVTDPVGPFSGAERVLRGGSRLDNGAGLRSAKRGSHNPGGRLSNLGFRLAYKQIPNQPPTDLNTTAPLIVAENIPIGSVIGEFNATDTDANATLTYHFVSGDNNNAFFTLEQNGTLKTATDFDFELNAPYYLIQISSKDEYNATIEGNFTVLLTDQNEPPIIASIHGENMLGSLQQAISIDENTNFAFDINASDPDGDNLIYEKTGGADQNLFTLNITTGIFSFASQPDYESPQDADQNNTYEVWFRAKDDNNSYDEKRLTIHVTDVFENAPPSFQSDGNLTVSENTTFVYEFNATDPDGDVLTYSILHGPDASLFDLNQSSGALTFFSPKTMKHRRITTPIMFTNSPSRLLTAGLQFHST